jgi:geranylgeranyl reductase family protein
METCDVLIIGGGPAGSSCARRLTGHGLDVVVLDKQQFPRDKVCAGWVTPAVFDVLGIDPEIYRDGRVLQPITGFRTGLIGGRGVETRYDAVVSYGIRRCEFDDFLLRGSGARLRLGEPVKSIEPDGPAWVVNGAIRARMLVGAGGHFCPVARKLGARLGSRESVVAAKEAEFPMTSAQLQACNVSGETPELFFCRDLKGYAWCFRKGDYLNIGLGREDNHRLTEKLEAFVQELKELGRIPQDIPARFHGHAYVLYRHTLRRLVADGALLVGDAAGLAYPESGEGIRPAVESGLLAARAILDAEGDFSVERLSSYEAMLVSRFGDDDPPAAEGVVAAIRGFLGARLLSSRWFARHMVLDRWFLHRHQERLELEPVQTG